MADAFSGCGVWDATASAGHHPAFGHLPQRGRLAHLALESIGMLWASADYAPYPLSLIPFSLPLMYNKTILYIKGSECDEG